MNLQNPKQWYLQQQPKKIPKHQLHQQDVKATEVTQTTAKVTWSEATDNVGVVGYNVYVNETKVNDALVTGTEYAFI